MSTFENGALWAINLIWSGTWNSVYYLLVRVVKLSIYAGFSRLFIDISQAFLKQLSVFQNAAIFI